MKQQSFEVKSRFREIMRFGRIFSLLFLKVGHVQDVTMTILFVFLLELVLYKLNFDTISFACGCLKPVDLNVCNIQGVSNNGLLR